MVRNSVFTILNLIWIIIPCYGVIKLTPNEDVDYKDIIRVELLHPRIHRRSFSASYDILLKFNISSKPVILKLEENAQLNTRIPTYILKGNGSIIRETDNTDSQSTHYFYDTATGASFLIQYNGTEKMHMYGTFHYEKDDYLLEYKNDKSYLVHKESQQGSTIYNFKVWKPPSKEVPSTDTIKELSKELVSNAHKPIPYHHHHRRRRKRSPAYNVELLYVLDYSIYKHWFDKSTGSTRQQRDANAKNSIKQFYAFVMNGMIGRYQSMSPNFMSIAFAGLIISESRSDSLWTEGIVSSGEVNAHKALTSFSDWVKAKTDLPSNDHVMLLTRHSLKSGESSELEGYAFVGAICTSASQSIVEESDDYLMITVVAHELGHSLGARHDGNNNLCKAGDFYIMAPNSNLAVGNRNPFLFSSCSVNYFQTTIQNLDSRNMNCLKSFGPGYNPNALGPYSGKLPGELYTADQQCTTVYGQGSTLCREHYDGNFAPMCGLMWCRVPNSGGTCRSMMPGDGTLCGNKKWCVNGLCSYSSRAPSALENCVHGNYIGTIDAKGRSCDDIVKLDITECYRERIGSSCCGSCAKVSSGVKGCFYGDRVPSALCNKTACPYYSQEELKQCCKSCSAYFTVPEENGIPTESDGTTEILIGISVPIVIIAIVAVICIHRRRNQDVSSSKPLSSKNRKKETKPKPARPAPSKPTTNGSTDSKSSNKLISFPILNSHTNANLKTDSKKNGVKGKSSMQASNGQLGSNDRNHNPEVKFSNLKSGLKEDKNKGLPKRNPDLNKPLAHNRLTSKTETSKFSGKTSETNILIPKEQKSDQQGTENDSSTSIKDRIAALKSNTDKTSTNSGQLSDKNDSPRNPPKPPQISSKPSAIRPVPASNKTPATNSKIDNLRQTGSDLQSSVTRFDKQALKPPGKTYSNSEQSESKFDKKPLRPPIRTDSDSSHSTSKFDKKPLRPPSSSGSDSVPSVSKFDKTSLRPTGKLVSDNDTPSTFHKKPLRPAPGKPGSEGEQTSISKFDKKPLHPPPKPRTAVSNPSRPTPNILTKNV